MPHARPEDLPNGSTRWPAIGTDGLRTTQWDDESRMQAKYPGSDWPDEVIEAGEACFIPSRHVLTFKEPSKVLELNPPHALQMCMGAMQKAITDMKAQGLDAAPALSA